MNILDTIVAAKRKEVEQRKRDFPIGKVMKRPGFTHEVYPFVGFLRDPNRNSIIGEFKRKSPSKGWINEKADVGAVTRGYTSYGASALSVLTDESFFGGHLDDINVARMCQIPILRKDFIVDEYQVLETKATGADVMLLIAACLSKEEVKDLAHTAKNLGLNVLLELHSEEELEMINDDIDVVGINNRNLKTFEVDIEHSIRMAHQIPEICKISESGINKTETIHFLKEEGFEGFLMGERFMKEPKPWIAFARFVKELKG